MNTTVSAFQKVFYLVLILGSSLNLYAMGGEVVIISDFVFDENPEQLNAPNTNMLARAILEERCPIVVSIGLLLNLNHRATYFLDALKGTFISDEYAQIIQGSSFVKNEFKKATPTIKTIKELYAESAQQIAKCIDASKSIQKHEDPCSYYSQELKKIPQKIPSSGVYHYCAWDAFAAECLVSPENWDIYKSPHGFVLMIPKKYLTKRKIALESEIKKIRKNLEKAFPDKKESGLEFSLITGFDFASESLEWEATTYQDLVKEPSIDEEKFSSGHTKLGEIFFGIPEYVRQNDPVMLEIFELIPQWTIIVTGHGNFSETRKLVAGMPFSSFEKLLKRINSHTKTGFLAYKTCYASGISQSYFDKITLTIDLKFPIVSDALADTSSIGLDFLPITTPDILDCLIPEHARFSLPIRKNGVATCFDLLAKAWQEPNESFEKRIEKILNNAEKTRNSGGQKDRATFIQNLSPQDAPLASLLEQFISQKQNHCEFKATLEELLKTYPPAQKKTDSRDSIIAEALESLFGTWDRQVFQILNPRSSWKTIKVRSSETIYTGKGIERIGKLPLEQSFVYSISYKPEQGFSVRRSTTFTTKKTLTQGQSATRAIIEDTLTTLLDFGEAEDIKIYSAISKNRKDIEGFTAHIIQKIRAPKINTEDLLEGFCETLEYLKTPQAFLIQSAELSPNLFVNNLIVVLFPGIPGEAPLAYLIYEYKGKTIALTIEIINHKQSLKIDRNVKSKSNLFVLYTELSKKMTALFEKLKEQEKTKEPTDLEKVPSYQKLLAEYDRQEKEGSVDAWFAQLTENERNFLNVIRPKPSLQSTDSNKN